MRDEVNGFIAHELVDLAIRRFLSEGPSDLKEVILERIIPHQQLLNERYIAWSRTYAKQCGMGD